MDYRGFNIEKINSARWGTFYRAVERREPGGLLWYVATDADIIGINRAVDDYLETGRPQFRYNS